MKFIVTMKVRCTVLLQKREYVPFLAWGKGIKAGVNLGTRPTFADIAATIAEVFGVKLETKGTSFLQQITK